MSKVAKTGETPKTDQIPFEEALQKLESIVEAMEAGDMPLDTLLTRFEEGTRLARVCQVKLADAELKIQKIEKNAAGEAVLTPLSADLSAAD